MFGIDDPSALLRPWKNLQQFSEELYAMLSRGKIESPGQQRKPEGRPRPSFSAPEAREPDAAGAAPAGMVRKARLEAAKASTRLPDAVASASRADGGQAPAEPSSGHESTRRSPPPLPERMSAPAPAASPDRRRDSTGSLIEQRIVNAPPGDDHASTRRRNSHNDNSVAVPDPPATERRAGQPDDRKPPAFGQQQEPAPVSQGSVERIKAKSEPSAPEEFRSVNDIPIKRPRREGNSYKELDIGDFAKFSGGGGEGGTPMSLGKVTASASKQATVDLYDSGPFTDSTATGVTVRLPTLHEDERIDVDAWLPAIYTFTDADGNTFYYAYPPIWVS